MNKRITAGLTAFLLSTTSLQAATLLPNAQQQFFSNNGVPLAGGTVGFYIPGTTTLKPIYNSASGGTQLTNPLILDSAGRPSNVGPSGIYGIGQYRQILKDASGNLIWDQLTSDTSSASNLGWGGTSGGTANAQTITASTFANVDGQTLYFVAGLTNTGPTTLSVNAGTAIAVVRDTGTGPLQLAGGEIVANNVIGVTYVASTGQFNLITTNASTNYTGEVRTFAASGCPTGWLAADGSAVSATTYANLFAYLGTSYGTSAGNVVLPDFRAAFLRGASAGRTTMPGGATVTTQAIGSAGYAGDLYLNHAHGVTDPGHVHSYTQPYSSGNSSAPGVGYTLFYSQTANTVSSTTGLTVNTSTTGGTETQPRNYAVQYCIKY